MPTLGAAYVQIVPSADGIKGSIENVLKGESASAGTSAGESIASRIKSMIIKAGIGVAITKGIKTSLDLGGELQQNLGGTEAVFGEFATSIQKDAENAYKNMGLSASDYMATANKMGSLFQGSGLSQVRSLTLTSLAMQRAADVASVMGIDTTAAMESIAGAAKGNFTMMDNLGVAMNATTLEAYALEKGMNFEWKTASNAEKAELAMKMFMDRTSQYAGNFARESEETFSGSFGAMAAAAKNVMANLSLGRDISGPLGELQKTVVTFVTKNLVPMLGNIVKALPQVFNAAVSTFKVLLSKLAGGASGLVNTGIQLVGSLVSGIVSAIPDLAYAAVQIVTSLGTYILSGDWIPVVLGVLNNIKMAFLNGIDESFGQGEDLFGGIKDAFTSIDWAGAAQTVLDFLSNALALGVEVIPQVLQNIGLTAINFFQSIDWVGLGQKVINFIVAGIQMLAANIPTYMQNIGKTAMTLFRAINWIQLGRTVITLIKSGIQALFTIIPTLLKSIGQGAINFFKAVNWKEVGRTVINLIKMGINALRTAIPAALKAIGTSAMNGFKSINWASVGWAVINGIKNGISALASSLLASIRSLGSMALGAIKGILGIHSPSKAFAEVGRDMALGIEVGWEKNLPTDEMVSDAEQMTKQIAGAASYSYSPGAVRADTPEGKLDAILEILAAYIPGIANRDVVLDNGKLVGALAPEINRKLGVTMGW